MPLITYCIRTVPEREPMYHGTLVALGQERVISVIDTRREGVRAASVKALRAGLDSPADWLVILDDDFRYCRDFPARVAAVARMTSMRALILYSMAKPRNRVVEKIGPFEVRKADRRHLLCVPMLRRDAAKLLLDALRSSDDPTAFDGVGARAIHDAEMHYGVVWPNPVDHIGRQSIIGNSWRVGGRERVSAWFEENP